MAARERVGPHPLLRGERPREVGEVLGHRQQDRPVDPQPRDDLDLEGDRPRHVARVAGDLAVALQRVHVAEVDAAAVDLHRADEDRPGPDRVDVHVAVGLRRGELLGRHRVAVRGADEERAEVAGVVRVGHRRGRGRPELAQERPQPGREADDVVRGEREDRVLLRAVGQRRAAGGVGRERLGRLPRHGEADPAGLVEGDRGAVRERERERGGVGAAARAADRLRPDALEAGLRPLGAAAGADRGAVRVAVEAAVHRPVVARRRRDRGDLDVADTDRDRVADLGALDGDRPADLVAAADRRRDHRAPAAGGGVDDDVGAVGDRVGHRDVGAEQPVGERVDKHGPPRGGRAGLRLDGHVTCLRRSG